MTDQGRADEQRFGDEPRDGAEETIRDLDVPADEAGGVAGGARPYKYDDIELKNG